ncbi:MAG: lactate racemase domain-containing protein, partial [Oscillospiraceae bacterium]
MAMESVLEGNVVTKLCEPVKLPRMVKIRQRFDETHLTPEEIPGIVRRQLARPEIEKGILPGMQVAITCGSRGVANVALITKAIADFVKERGAFPFVFPAMGSHGGATAEGQRKILEGYGVTEEFVGCPIRATMETVEIGRLEDGMPVYMDKYAHDADAIILSGRIKAHTAFRGPHESGLMKMAVIGMGKQHGAETVHESGFINMGALMPRVAKVVLGHANVVAAVGMIENAFDQTYKIAALTKEEIWTEEPKLLLEAKSKMGRIWFDAIDELVVDRIGKDISGDGMDPNVTGRFACADSASGGIQVKRI